MRDFRCLLVLLSYLLQAASATIEKQKRFFDLVPDPRRRWSRINLPPINRTLPPPTTAPGLRLPHEVPRSLLVGKPSPIRCLLGSILLPQSWDDETLRRMPQNADPLRSFQSFFITANRGRKQGQLVF